MALEKYGVEDRKSLIKAELKEVKKKLQEKTASEEEIQFLIQREQDLQDALKEIN